MGFFDFISDAGAKVFGKDKPEKDVTMPIIKHIENSGVSTEYVNTDFKAGVVTLSGYVPNNEQKEKAVLTAGNIAGVSRVQDNLLIGTPPDDATEAVKEMQEHAVKEMKVEGDSNWESRTYTVKSGDTLGKIAKQFYGDAMKYPKIFEANQPMLENPDKIYPGQVLRIPK
ncbi:peptidoglycan-binding protein LysM [Marinicella gelatinilytica]|uniref:peptidoglycan-binding protein LysM n=1 Tax=Marinicella gelatinilytica TaxID=2996017 RepID=UPI00226093EE|nr:peptidoglycan-binding protein LysM [Marinicella gelatinilytica]MCX7544961.1 peptidoglycan-binding protein LysM [Marinicella gelatinilytica]